MTEHVKNRFEFLYWKTRAALVPHLENSQYAYAQRLRAALKGAQRWLDIGCGHAVFPDWLARRQPKLELNGHLAVGLDPDRHALAKHNLFKLRVEGDGGALPFRDGTFDIVTANMVLEHVSDSSQLFQEVARALKPNGRFLVHTPNAGGYTTALTRLIPAGMRRSLAAFLLGRSPEDVYPTYYRANRASTLHRLANESGLQVERVEFVQTSPQLMAIAPLMLAEMLLIRALETTALSGFRACLIVEFRKT